MSDNFTLAYNGKILSLSTPKIMGVININNDSFYSGSRIQTESALIDKAEKMLMDGAAIIDIGVASSRPGAAKIDVATESALIKQYLPKVRHHLKDSWISIDTYNSQTAELALDLGADMINDISGGHIDIEMLKTINTRNCPFVAMHMRGTPDNMQSLINYNDIMLELIEYFNAIINQSNPLVQSNLVIDPGIGFAKSLDQNYKIINDLSTLKIINKPILIGISRKSLIYRFLEISIEDSLNGTSVLNTIALLKGANILRVHDVQEANQVISLYNKVKNS
jgi:dihydropteroate synthase